MDVMLALAIGPRSDSNDSAGLLDREGVARAAGFPARRDVSRGRMHVRSTGRAATKWGRTRSRARKSGCMGNTATSQRGWLDHDSYWSVAIRLWPPCSPSIYVVASATSSSQFSTATMLWQGSRVNGLI